MKSMHKTLTLAFVLVIMAAAVGEEMNIGINGVYIGASREEVRLAFQKWTQEERTDEFWTFRTPHSYVTMFFQNGRVSIIRVSSGDCPLLVNNSQSVRIGQRTESVLDGVFRSWTVTQETRNYVQLRKDKFLVQLDREDGLISLITLSRAE